MKLIKAVLGAIAGAALATIVCWGLLYAYGAFVLGGSGSLFDTNPQAATNFFVGWAVVSLLSAVAGAFVVTRRGGA